MSKLKNILTKSYSDQGLLFMRLGLGIMFLIHGFPKISGGPEVWSKIGGAMGNLGITFAPTFWGFMAAFSEFGGGFLLICGLFTRPASFLLASTMLVATVMHYSMGDSFAYKTSRPLELMIVFIGLFLLGAGKFSLDSFLFDKDRSKV